MLISVVCVVFLNPGPFLLFPLRFIPTHIVNVLLHFSRMLFRYEMSAGMRSWRVSWRFLLLLREAGVYAHHDIRSIRIFSLRNRVARRYQYTYFKVPSCLKFPKHAGQHARR